jgi:hypothetical protein
MARDQEGLPEVEEEAHYVKLAEDLAQQLLEQVQQRPWVVISATQ